MHVGAAVTGKGKDQSLLDDVEMPPASQDLVIMNPPFTSGGSDYQEGNPQRYNKKQFHGLGTDWETQEKMFKLASKYAKGTCAHGYAGIASWFVALADRMVKELGIIALVLPMTSLQGPSWLKVRQLIANSYRDVMVLTISAPREYDRSFSAETGMAETMIICRKSPENAPGRGLFVSLVRRPRNEMEAIELARAINTVAKGSILRTLEDGPFGGNTIYIGEEKMGEVVDAPLDQEIPWSTVGITDFSVAHTAYQLAKGNLSFPGMSPQSSVGMSMASIDRICQVGIVDVNIVGNGRQTAFERVVLLSDAPTFLCYGAIMLNMRNR